MYQPPSGDKHHPITNFDPSLARYTAARAKSSSIDSMSRRKHLNGVLSG